LFLLMLLLLLLLLLLQALLSLLVHWQLLLWLPLSKVMGCRSLLRLYLL